MKINNVKDAKKIAQKILNKKYGKPKIESITHPTGTNVWTIEAHAGESDITLNLDKDSGLMLGEPKSRKNLVRNVVETITIKEKVSRILRNESNETHWEWLIPAVCLTVSGSVVSAFFDPLTGITISVIFGGLSIWYGRSAFTHHITIDRG